MVNSMRYLQLANMFIFVVNLRMVYRIRYANRKHYLQTSFLRECTVSMYECCYIQFLWGVHTVEWICKWDKDRARNSQFLIVFVYCTMSPSIMLWLLQLSTI